MAKTKIAAVQMDVEIGEVVANRQRILEKLREAAAQEAQLVIFPECALTGYCFTSLEEALPFAETANGESANLLAQACRDLKIHAVVGFIEKDGANYFNAALLISPERIVGAYRKVHLPFLGVDRFLAAGHQGFNVFATGLGKIGMNICYDINFPEAPRVLKLAGAELYVLPTNWPTGAWRTPKFMLNARAQENHFAVVAVNRVGTERGWRFIGQSKIVDCMGDVIVEASEDKEEMLFAEVDLQESNRNKIVNVAGSYEVDRLADRRPEFYGAIASATNADDETQTTEAALGD
ncbi:MAG: carbon-nitrogen hydrolase family protein [Acidobacteria bacterium]|nr:carbon-nitrogen hydrolase family protein [Acidobacteriota bacterium]